MMPGSAIGRLIYECGQRKTRGVERREGEMLASSAAPKSLFTARSRAAHLAGFIHSFRSVHPVQEIRRAMPESADDALAAWLEETGYCSDATNRTAEREELRVFCFPVVDIDGEKRAAGSTSRSSAAWSACPTGGRASCSRTRRRSRSARRTSTR